ncbi:MAG TPA: ABC transporter permease [Acetobacteraceae bacterium]|nr:ABC transporter permease [Acetobacteraceae bacterium]
MASPPRSRRSLAQRCLTPKAEIPRGIALSTGVGVWVLVIALWMLACYGGLANPIFLPSPDQVIGAAVRLAGDGRLGRDVWASVQVILLGFAVSSLFAVPVGLLMGTFGLVRAAVEPLTNFIRYLPVTSFVPLFILWIGIGLQERVTVIVFGTFFQQLVMIADVSRNVSGDLLNASYTLGANRRDAVLHVLGPASLPGVLDTLRVTMGWAWTYLVVAELVAASSGLGYISMQGLRGFQVDQIFMAIAIIGILGLITDQIFSLLRRWLAPWAA